MVCMYVFVRLYIMHNLYTKKLSLFSVLGCLFVDTFSLFSDSSSNQCVLTFLKQNRVSACFVPCYCLLTNESKQVNNSCSLYLIMQENSHLCALYKSKEINNFPSQNKHEWRGTVRGANDVTKERSIVPDPTSDHMSSERSSNLVRPSW